MPNPTPLFQHPDWRAIAARLAPAVIADRRSEWLNEVTAWAGSVAASLNQQFPVGITPYRLDQSPHLIVVSVVAAQRENRLPGFGEMVLASAREFLGPSAATPEWPTAAFFIHGPQAFNAYLNDTVRNVRLMPGGAFISGSARLPHIALLANPDWMNQRLYFAHELIHSLLYEHDLPVWLDEGLSCHLELAALRRHNVEFTSVLDVKRNQYWQQRNLEDFWSGRWRGGEGAGAGYALSARLLRRLLKEDKNQRQPARLREFIKLARSKDSGEAASKKVYERPLVSFMSELLGPGSWIGSTADKQ